MEKSKLKVGIIGATGYAGAELVRLLLQHPQAELAALGSVSFEGKPLDEIYPNFHRLAEQTLTDPETVVSKADLVFTSVPHGVSEAYACACKAGGKKMIDLGADFRLEAPENYTAWYGGCYEDLALHQSAVYGLPELYREAIAGAWLVGNPGCYPTAAALGLYPAIAAGLLDPADLIIDAKSGVTGAGRGLSQTTHYPDCNEGFSPYKIACHRHTPEIEQTLTRLGAGEARITFVPHLLPVNRGILATMYGKLLREVSLEEVQALYEETYAKEPFVRICPRGEIANLKNVRLSNYCDISLHMDPRTHRLIVVSAIDNMVKGAAGQAIQNMNLMFGFSEQSGLLMVPPAF